MTNETPKKCAQCDAELAEDNASSLCPKCLLQVGFETQKPESDESQTTAYQPSFIPPTAEELAPLFTQLEILEVIGHGGMGVVYKARQTELDRIVALKILRPGIVDDASFSERFQREARALAKLNHPSIITVYDFGRRDELFYFLMEYVDGTNLRHLEREGNLTASEALAIVPQVCAALQYAHDNGVVHRDIKPENILITKDGDVRIADFGLAKLAGTVDDAPLTGTWQVMGTPHYMAPEQFEKPTTVDHRADIYSLGVVIYELLTGELPLGRFPLPSQKAQIDVRLDEVVLRSLDKEPARRYQHVTDVATAVQEASEPQEASRVGQAADWVRNKATAFGEQAQSLTKNRPNLKTPFRRLVHWLGERRRGLGTALVVSGVADAACAIGTMAGLFGHIRDEHAFFAFMSLIAAVITFLLGRQLRRNYVGSTLKLMAVFCLLPWYNVMIPMTLVRLLLVAGGLLSTLSKDHPFAEQKEYEPDFVDRVEYKLRAAWNVFSFRALLFVLFGVVGWTVTCIFAGVTTMQYLMPYSVTIRDDTALGLKPTSEAYRDLDIRSTASRTVGAFEDFQGMLERDQLELYIRHEKASTAILDVDLTENTCCIMQGRAQVSEDMPIDDQSVTRWMARNGIETTTAGVDSEVSHLTEVLLLMQATRGLIDQIPDDLNQQFPTLTAPIARMKRTRGIMAQGMIPAGALIDSSSFDRPPTGFSFSRYHRIGARYENMFIIGAVALWLVGLLRVFRVLFLQLFSREVRDVNVDKHRTVVRWRWCSLAICLAGVVIVCSAGLLQFNKTIEVGLNSARFTELTAELNGLRPETILIAFMLLGATVVLSGLMARPWLRSFGWWTGCYGGVISMLAFPFNLLTFPTGLSACIALTDKYVGKLFRRDTDAAHNTDHEEKIMG